MELSWSTFVLEVVNFVVLVWILHRFLYRPVLAVIDQRRSAIEAKLHEAHRVNDEAEALKDQYESRLKTWEAERSAAQDQLADELGAERARRLQDLEAELEERRQKAGVAAERQAAEHASAVERQALQQAADFSSELLGQASGPELESRLVQLLLDDLDGLSSDQIEALRDQWGEPPSVITVSSAFALDDNQRHGIESRLRQLSGLEVPVHFELDPGLLAGVLIELGAWTVGANVRDELAGFAEIALAGR
jgi:F-type H+-transporting ATPase subunit b